MMSYINKKLQIFRDTKIFLKIWLISLKLNFLKSGNILKFIDISSNNLHHLSSEATKKLDRYVTICLWLRRKLKLGDTCLNRSLLRCRILRQAGVDARINFGLRKAESFELATLSNNITGHCWVTINNEQVPHNFPFVYQYPNNL